MTSVTDGIINVNKPEGWTSQDVCSKLRHVLHIRKTGHTGTLDPMATGVLPVCLGKATRIIEYYDKDKKSYHASMKLGISTDTLDITGEIIKTCDYSNVTEKSVTEAFKAYSGRVMQVPPKYSALKINGKRAYDLAREGKDFELKAREITIYDNKVTHFDPENGIVEFDVTCSKGTYIRTIVDDIGRALGCGASMTALTRTASGFFRIEDAHTLDEIIAASEAQDDEEALRNMIIPADVTLENLGKIVLNDNRVTAFLNGNSSRAGGFRIREQSGFVDMYRVYAKAGLSTIPDAGSGPADLRNITGCKNNTASNDSDLKFLGIGEVRESSLVPKKVIR